MNTQLRWLSREAYGSASLSLRTILLVFPFGVVVAALTMPFGVSSTSVSAWLTALAAQITFSLCALMGNALLRVNHEGSGDAGRLLIVMIAGAVRGAVLVVAAAGVAGTDLSWASILTRSINSTLFSILAVAFMGLLVESTINYRAEYRVLLERALRLEQENAEKNDDLDSRIIAQWVGVQRSLRATAARTRAELERAEASPDDLHSAAQVISDALVSEVRPMSHGLWAAGARGVPRLRTGSLLWDALRPWRPPVLVITLVYLLISLVGAITRAGALEGVVFALYSTATVGILLALSARIGVTAPRTRSVGIVTLLLLPLVVVAVAQFIGQVLLGAREDLVGAFVAGVSASIITLGLVVLRRVSVEREILLIELQSCIDAAALGVLAQRAATGHWERSLGEFVHHSVQSELTAMRLQLVEASTQSDLQRREQARQSTLARFDRLLALDPPWRASRSGREVITDVVQAWDGIATIRAELTAEGSDRQWRRAGQVVEEGVANAIRSGGARSIMIEVASDGDALVVRIVDDGTGLADGHTQGLGTLWLDQVVPGAWLRSSGAQGTELVVRIS